MHEWNAHQRTSLQTKNDLEPGQSNLCLNLFQEYLAPKENQITENQILIKVYSLYLENTKNKKMRKYRHLSLIVYETVPHYVALVGLELTGQPSCLCQLTYHFFRT